MPYTKAFFLIVVVSAILLFVKLGSITVFQIAEARNSEVPAEMQNRHDYTVPYFNGEWRTDKPPLHYYTILFSYYIGRSMKQVNRDDYWRISYPSGQRHLAKKNKKQTDETSMIKFLL